MPKSPPADFLAIAEKRSSSQLEASLEWMRKKADAGDPIAQDMVRWTEDILQERAKTENQPVIGADGHQYTQRQYREKQQRDSFQAGMNALRGNFASALTFQLTGDPHLAGLLGGLFEAIGGAAEGRNQNRAVSPDDSGSYGPQRVGEPSEDAEPSTDAPGPLGSTAGPSNSSYESLTWADIQDYAEAVFAVPDSVVDAARELTSLDVPVTEATADFLDLFTAAATEDEGEDEGGNEGENQDENQDDEGDAQLAYLDDDGGEGEEGELAYLDEGEGDSELAYLDDAPGSSGGDARSDSGDEGDDGSSAGAAVVGSG